MLAAMLTACGVDDADERELVQQLFFTYGQRVKALAGRILRNEQDAEDALHDTFLKIIRYRKKFVGADPAEIKRLIVIIAKSVCFNLYRRKSRRAPALRRPTRTLVHRMPTGWTQSKPFLRTRARRGCGTRSTRCPPPHGRSCC